ncbi:hypothetical protein TNCV_2333791 [Trichonephila clavipes]|nr:hypothetical protein TNCV_2333791 [Trichonephila clavipes]
MGRSKSSGEKQLRCAVKIIARENRITGDCRSQEEFSLKIPEGSELVNMVANDAQVVAKLAANLVAENDTNLALPPRFRQVLIESSL